MITLQELCSYLDDLLQVENFKDYCPNGLQVEGKKEVRKVATAVSASVETIKAAVEAGVDLLLVHHGMFWSRDPYPVVGAKREKLAMLIENDISLLAYHLPLDAHAHFGNNWKAARDMGWENLEPFDLDGMPVGVKGALPVKTREELEKLLEDYYAHRAHGAPGGPQEIATAVLISGGAYRYMSEAAKEGADCFITGNFDEPAWHMAFEERINFFAMGHSATEVVGPKALGNHLKKEFDLDVQFLDIYNPF
ncbi:MAG: Nif3-like dinuclear metal center hexameric protein [Chlamydiales bacterium]|nr:Nif3-like dinuclear metal center hexameric protein [Chlamydiia bacterium]MCP5508187.1 Nif3-like dinuclear metal center hexameric protein [Chlamydiales bacterium]